MEIKKRLVYSVGTVTGNDIILSTVAKLVDTEDIAQFTKYYLNIEIIFSTLGSSSVTDKLAVFTDKDRIEVTFEAARAKTYCLPLSEETLSLQIDFVDWAAAETHQATLIVYVMYENATMSTLVKRDS